MNSGLSKIAKTEEYGYRGQVVRGMQLAGDLEDFKKRWKIGKKNQLRAFWSSSYGDTPGYSSGTGVWAHVKLKYAKANINKYSSNSGEREVLLPAGTELECVKIKETKYRTHFYFEER